MVPDEPAPPPERPVGGVDPRGAGAALAMMLALGLLGLRPAPTPREPVPVPITASAEWMLDALPGIGVKGRERAWERLRMGDVQGLPERAREAAAQAFAW